MPYQCEIENIWVTNTKYLISIYLYVHIIYFSDFYHRLYLYYTLMKIIL